MTNMKIEIKRMALLGAVLATSGCVTPGTGGTTSNYIDASAGSLSDRRSALKTVAVIETVPPGARDLGGVFARRCHRNLLEEEPSTVALIPDLRTAAYGQGADAIKIISIDKQVGLAANCWYVLEGRAEMYSLQKP